MARYELDVSASGSRLELRAPDELVLRFSENPTTGFRWALEPLDTGVLTCPTSTFSPSSTAIGAGGVRNFTLQPVAAGTAQVKLKLWRAWEGEGSTSKRFELTVTVS